MNYQFKPGDKVVLIANPNMNAPIGSKATVIESTESFSSLKKVVSVEWEYKIAQMNGGYYAENFKLIEPDWDE